MDSQQALVNVAMNGPHKILGISWPHKRLLDSEGLCSIELLLLDIKMEKRTYSVYIL
jgi:hypothetical protein